MVVAITSGELTAEIDPLGAQLSRLRDGASRELLWDGDPSVWKGRAPILFPIVGALAGGQYRLGARTYSLSRHGFARDKLFSIEGVGPSSALFRLSADEATAQVYPFAFELDVHFEVKGPTLVVTSSVRNKGREPMPASFGYHPAFRWPLPFGQPRSSHVIEFETDESAPCRRIDAVGLLVPERYANPVVERRLALSDALFLEDVLIFDAVRSRFVIYGGAHGPRLRVGFPDAPYLGIWTKPGAHFICIEPWHGVTDPEGYRGDFADKPGIFIVQPGDAVAAVMMVGLV